MPRHRPDARTESQCRAVKVQRRTRLVGRSVDEHPALNGANGLVQVDAIEAHDLRRGQAINPWKEDCEAAVPGA